MRRRPESWCGREWYPGISAVDVRRSVCSTGGAETFAGRCRHAHKHTHKPHTHSHASTYHTLTAPPTHSHTYTHLKRDDKILYTHVMMRKARPQPRSAVVV